MEYNTNQRYFKKRLFPLYIGILMAIAGYINVFYFIFVDSLFLYNFSVVLMILGILMVVFFFVSLVRDSELDKSAKTRIKGILDTAAEKAAAIDKHVRIMDSYVAESYVFGGDKALFKKGRDGTFRSNRYSATAFLISAKKLFVYSLEFSLTENYEDDNFRVYNYENLENLFINGDVFHAISLNGKKTYEVETHTINAVSDGETVSYPSHDDSLADSMIAMVLNRKDKQTVEI